MTTRFKVLLALISALLMLLGLAGPTSGQSPTYQGSSDAARPQQPGRVTVSNDLDEPQCDRPPGAKVEGRPANPSSEAHPDLAWLEHGLAQAHLRESSQALKRNSESIIGSFIDYDQQKLIVVLDPESNAAGNVQRGLELAAQKAPNSLRAENQELARPLDLAELSEGELAAYLAPSKEPVEPQWDRNLEIDLVYGCRSKQEIIAERKALRQRDWHPDASSVSMAIGTDVATSKNFVVLARDEVAVAEALRETFGDSVEVRLVDEAPGRDGRLNDGSPHYGGARIGPKNAGDCTAGFAMDRRWRSGDKVGRWMATAAHCASEGTSMYSGDKYYGITKFRSFPDPYDAMLIGSGTQQYERTLHTDPCCPSTRLVTAKGGNWVGQSVCISGSFTKAVCGGVVQASDDGDIWDELCDSAGCSTAIRVTRNSTWTQGGDSGAPLYQRLSNNRARLRGLHIGGFRSGGVATGYFHSVSQVETAVGATAATTCCTSDSW